MKRVGILSAIYAVALTLPAPVLAEEHGGGKAALPQLDVTLYPGLLFWVGVSFILFFIVMKTMGVPGVQQTQEKRQSAIGGDLSAARSANDQAQQVMEAYEKALHDARLQAFATVNTIIEVANREAAEQREKQSQDLSHRMIVAEDNIAKAREEALKEVPNLVGDLVKDILSKVNQTGIAGTESKARA